MPDVDLLPLTLGPGWAKVRNYLEDESTTEEVAWATASAVAKTLRGTDGVPSLPEIAEELRLAAHAAEYQLDLGLASSEVCELRADSVPTMIAKQVASALITTRRAELASASPKEARGILALETVRELARHYGLDRIAVLLLRDPQRRPTDLAARLDLVLQHQAMVSLGASFARWPTGGRLRAPRRPRSRAPLPIDADLESF